MGHKRQFQLQLNWQTTSPITNFLPLKMNQSTSVPSGVVSGTMTGTSTIYSQIVDTSLIDNIGLELNYTGTPTGTISIFGSNSGVNFYALTFNPVLTQPAGSAGGYLVDLTQFPWKYFLIEYTNSSGTGALTAYIQFKDLN